MAELPTVVEDAVRRAEAHEFTYSCDPIAGALLATLAAAIAPGGRILELGTGYGVGTAWLAHGLGDRKDVQLITVEQDKALAEAVAAYAWQVPIETRIGDAESLLATIGTFDLIFADAEGGKWSGLELTLDALKPGGVLIVDDMDLARYPEQRHADIVTSVREALHADPRLVTAELPTGSGMVIATRRHHDAR